MADVDFLTLDDVQFIHRDQTTRYGGDPGIRDRNLLDSALAQPRASFGAEFLHAFPFEMAAAYLYHIVRNHPFLDGNKRTGAVAALVFLDSMEFPSKPVLERCTRSPWVLRRVL